MKIYQAMKAKKKLITEIDQLKSKVRDNNSFPVGKKVNYDAKVMLEQLMAKSLDLVKLKSQIMKATMPIYPKLHAMSEMKSMASFLKGVPHQEGLISQHSFRGEVTPQEYKCVMNEVELSKMVTEMENSLEATQEEIDGFNHTTDI